jgi:hypothetical protein
MARAKPRGRIVEVFHATTGDRATEVISKGSFTDTKAEGNWLGTGVYFWEGNLQRALLWAQKHYSADPAVVRGTVCLADCLDLTQAHYAQLVRRGYEKLCTASAAAGCPLPSNDGDEHKLDCLVVNFLHDKIWSFASCRGAFTDGEQLFTSSAFRELTHIQICVRQKEMIIGPFSLETLGKI